MAPLKSQTQVEIYLGLLETLLLDLSAMYPKQAKSFQRDILTLRQRTSHEGLEFMTKTLPKLGKAFDRALETGVLEVPREFKRSPQNRSIPAFLQGMTSIAFDCYGYLRPEVPPRVVADIRQVLFVLYKLELPFSEQLTQEYCDKFVSTDSEAALPSQQPPLLEMACGLVSRILSDFDPTDIVPRHGPGAVSTGERMESKWLFGRFCSSLHSRYPWYEYFSCQGYWRDVTGYGSYGPFLEACTPPAKVVLVPKDSRGPRVISCEPLEYQWIQQGIARKLVHLLENSPITRGQVNFSDQSINGSLALVSSKHGYFSTIDLKDASDLVSLELVRAVIPTAILPYFEACRSTHTVLPDGRVVQMKKFAPMGSALCFPVEALIFWTICVCAVATSRNEPLLRAARDVYVYGDDIIVPSSTFHYVCESLVSFGLKVNADKSYVHGSFRESCGVDAFEGINVTPTKVHTLWSGSSNDGSALASYASYANDLARKGFNAAASYIRKHIRVLYGRLPYGSPGCGYPCIEVASRTWSVLLNQEQGIPVRYNAELQRPQVRVNVLRSSKRPTRLDSWGRLLRAITGSTGSDPSIETAPRQYKLRRVWMNV